MNEKKENGYVSPTVKIHQVVLEGTIAQSVVPIVSVQVNDFDDGGDYDSDDTLWF
ncbi:MAG: hypothetical protein LBH19_01750 [Dysgonamonadaceae bacterium]|jgi:hypothetical protein|nr:hypothetical protein [Dysgonamonadaceae bacterium]